MIKYSLTVTTVLLSTISSPMIGQNLIGESPTRARTLDGNYISSREHIIDDPNIAGFALSGSDDLVLGDLQRDGPEASHSVHDSAA